MNPRISIDPNVCHGKPVVKGTRTPVTVILAALAGGDSFESIEKDYDVTADDIRACIAFACEELSQHSYHKEGPMFDRIVSDPAILGGKPIIRGTRISVEIILEWMASGASRDDIVKNYPFLTVQDVEQALEFAAAMLRKDTHLTLPVSS